MRLLVFMFLGAIFGVLLAAGLGTMLAVGADPNIRAFEIGIYVVVGGIAGLVFGFAGHVLTFRSPDPQEMISPMQRLDSADSFPPNPMQEANPYAPPMTPARPAPTSSALPSLSGAVTGGVVMMVIAVVWFFAGLFLMDRIFFYPPILFIAGIVSIVRGLFSRE